MKKLIYLSAMLVLLITTQSCHDNRKAKNFNQKTLVDDMGHQFLVDANEAGLTEIQASALAEKNSQNPRVLRYAKMMLKDHSLSSVALKKIANDKLVTLNDTISTEHKAMISGLTKETGAIFDKAYMQMMETDHSKVIQIFHIATENTDRTVRNFAERNIPTLKLHLDSAKAICAALK